MSYDEDVAGGGHQAPALTAVPGPGLGAGQHQVVDGVAAVHGRVHVVGLHQGAVRTGEVP